MAVIYKVKSTNTIFNSMKQYMIGKASAITNFNVGSRIRTMFEAIASTNHRTQYDFQQAIKTAIPLAVFNGFEFEKNPGIQSNGELEFERDVAATEVYPIPAGTGISLDGVTYVTTIDGEISIGNTSSGNIASQASVVGIIGNIDIAGIDTVAGKGAFTNQPLGIEKANNPIAFSNGQDEETDEERLKRFREFINSLARSPVTGIEAGVKGIDTVIAASVVENDPVPGTNKIYVDDGSGILSASLQAEVEKVVNGDRSDRFNFPGYRAAGTTAIVLAPTLIDVSISIELRILSSSLSDDGTLETLASNAIQSYVNSLSLGYDVLRSEIIRVAKNVSVDVYDVNLTVPTGNIIINVTEKARIDSGSFSVTSVRITNP